MNFESLRNKFDKLREQWAEDSAVDFQFKNKQYTTCLLYTSPSPRDATLSRMPSSA